MEIAYLTSSYVRVIQTGNLFEVQAKRIRGEGKIGPLMFWKTLYGVWDREKAIRLLESYGSPAGGRGQVGWLGGEG